MRTLCPLAALLALAASAGAQTLVSNLNTSAAVPADSDPGPSVELSGRAFFAATLQGMGREPWISDGTPAGSAMVLDVFPGATGSFPDELVPVGAGTVAFVATEPSAGREVWISDGTAAGTRLLADLEPGSAGSSPHGLTFLGGALLALREDSAGTELWSIDPVTGQTALLASIPQAGGALPGEVEPLGAAQVVFSVNEGGGWSLWISDGTAAGTARVTQLSTTPDAAPDTLTAFGTRVLFWNDDGSVATLWVTDGTAAGTLSLAPSGVPTRGLNGFVTFGGRAYFSGTTPVTGSELWRTDGTPAGTAQFMEFAPGQQSGAPRMAGVVGGRLVFSAFDGVTQRLYATDGTFAGTQILADAQVGRRNGGSGVLHAGRLFFPAADASGEELWSSDGTAGGTALYADLYPTRSSGPADLEEISGRLYFAARSPALGRELWSLNALAQPVGLDLEPRQTDVGSSPRPLGTFAGRLYFDANAGQGREIWRTDGTAAGTERFLATASGAAKFSAAMVPMGSWFFVEFDDGVNGREPWRSDGTAAGSILLADTLAGAGSGALAEAVALAGKVVFSATSFNGGRELWVTDGTPAGTEPIDFIPGPSGLDPTGLVAQGGLVYFRGRTPAGGSEPFVSDGTLAGTRQLADLNPGSAGSTPFSFQPVGGRVVFIADDGVSGRELWVTDGTSAGTQQLADILSGPSSSTPRGFAPLGNRLLFFANDDVSRALWETDGTAAGTRRVAPLTNLLSSDLFPVNDGLLAFFYPGAGLDMWTTDGTAQGTGFAHHFGLPGFTSAVFETGRVGRERLLVTVDDGVHGLEPWVTDGTSAGTFLLRDISSGASIARDFARVGEYLVFSADDGLTGPELHAVPFVETDDWAREVYGAACASGTSVTPVIRTEGSARESRTAPFSIVLEGVSPGTPAVLAFALRPGLFSLGACTLLLDPSFQTLATLADGTGRAEIQVPPLAGIAGTRVDFQWAAVEPGGPLLGFLVTSAAVDVVFGP